MKMKKRRQTIQVESDPKTHEKYLKIWLTDSVRRQLSPLTRKNTAKRK
jgi:hypothetical protein